MFFSFENLRLFDKNSFSFTSRSKFHLWRQCVRHSLYSVSVWCQSSVALHHRFEHFSFFNSKFMSATQTSCSTRFREFALIPFAKYKVVFLSTFVICLLLVFGEDGSSFSTCSSAACRDFSLFSKICSYDSVSLSAWLKRNCSSSETSEEDLVISIVFIYMSCQILRLIIHIPFSSSLERNSAVALIQLAMCAILKETCNAN